MTKQEIVSLRVRRAVTKDVGLAGVMLYVPLVVQEAEISPAWTDGARMYFGRSFFEFSEEEQIAVCVHECLHVVFRHVQRGRKIYQKEGSAYRADLWNVACDAVINNSIARLPWARLPKHGVDLEKLLGADLWKAKPAHLWTSERVYDELKTRQRGLPVPSFILANDLNGSHLASGPGIAPVSHPQDRCPDSHQTEMETRIWRERIIRARAGSHPAGFSANLRATFLNHMFAGNWYCGNFCMRAVCQQPKAAGIAPAAARSPKGSARGSSRLAMNVKRVWRGSALSSIRLARSAMK